MALCIIFPDDVATEGAVLLNPRGSHAETVVILCLYRAKPCISKMCYFLKYFFMRREGKKARFPVGIYIFSESTLQDFIYLFILTGLIYMRHLKLTQKLLGNSFTQNKEKHQLQLFQLYMIYVISWNCV